MPKTLTKMREESDVNNNRHPHALPDAAPGFPTYIHRALHQMALLAELDRHSGDVENACIVCKAFPHLVPMRLAQAYRQNANGAKVVAPGNAT